MSYNQIFIEALREGYSTSIFTESELEFVTSKELIEVRRDRFWPKFVGEFTTPENSYFSLPKNFEATDENVELFKKVLQNYKELKGTDGKTLLTNNTFAVSPDGQLKSEKFYYNELKEFFLDYITYEYIYPQKQKKVHSTSPVTGGKIDVFTTMKMRKQKGPGITYKIKDVKNSNDWNLDDIYWSTINELSKKYATSDDTKQISEMRGFLEDQGYEFKTVDISDKDKIIKDINRCDVGLIHQPIKNTLIDYFKSRMISENFIINIFYTVKFQYVWEELVRDALCHNDDWKDELKDVFLQYKPTRRRYEEGDVPTTYRDLMPDLFSYDKQTDKCFIGDAKYYQDPDNSHFDKEMYVYNQLINNKYPMCVFIPSKVTRRIDVREQGDFELIVFKISVKDAINDAINKQRNTIEKIQEIIMKNCNRDKIVKNRLISGNFIRP
jgi:hypothetical protein